MSSPLVFQNNVEAIVHPLVVYSILDHFLRRDTNKSRVIGTLLGTNEEGRLSITSCYPVPHSEEGEQIGIDEDFHRTLLGLKRQASPNEIVLGWYSTSGNSESLNESSVLIHSFYGREIRRPPVHLTIEFVDGQVTVQAYMTTMIRLKDVELGAEFFMIPSILKMNELELCAMRSLVSASNPQSHGGKLLVDSKERVRNGVEELKDSLTIFKKYIEELGEGNGDSEAGRLMLSLCTQISNLGVDRSAFNDVVTNKIQDILMSVYIGKLTASQLVIGEKLTSSISDYK